MQLFILIAGAMLLFSAAKEPNIDSTTRRELFLFGASFTFIGLALLAVGG